MATENGIDTAYENLATELRRGLLALSALAECRTPQYGYSLKQRLGERGLEANEGTLYPLLRRLEEQGLLQSEWRLADESRPRRYYTISSDGERTLARLTEDWRLLSRSLDRLFEMEGEKP